jgi:caffeoyl-CoA O-methyltransferase
VLEIGTYSGYSSLSMAAGLPPDGHIDTLEILDRHAEVARRYHGRSPYADRITVHVGPAQATLERLDGPWDIVFIDADKASYRGYYDTVLPRLAERGLIMVDNTLWSGRVLEDDDGDVSDDTRAIKDFNDYVARDDRVTCVMLTVRDGITLIRRST